MSQFIFNTISRAEIERSKGGKIMLQAIDYDGDDNQIITGVPGSGKTTVTLMRAERLVAEEKNILLFTYQNLLKKSLINASSDELKSKITNFHTWYRRNAGNQDFDENDSIENILARLRAVRQLDEILIDEGQDFERKIYKALISKSSKTTVGADNAQKVHVKGLPISEIENELRINAELVPVRLVYNYRNTFEIYNFSRYFMSTTHERANSPLLIETMTKGLGNKPIVINVNDDRQKQNRLRIILEDAGEKNIAILLYHVAEVNIYYELVQNLGFACSKWHGNSQPIELENILITTYKSAKGMEFQVVIMPNMETAMDRSYKTGEHYYVGCTRARESLYLLCNGNGLPQYFNGFDEFSYELIDSNTV
jgi:superfamily I DNA/RNA helicase